MYSLCSVKRSLILGALFIVQLLTAQDKQKLSVYLLHGLNSRGLWQEQYDNSLQRLFREQNQYNIELNIEYLGYDASYPHDYNADITRYIQNKLEKYPADVVIGALAGATNFIYQNRSVFGETPKILVIPTGSVINAVTPDDNMFLIKTASMTALEKTFKVIQTVFPETKRVVVISGLAEADQFGRNNARAIYEKGGFSYQAEFWDGLWPEEIVDRLSKDSRDTVLFLIAYELAHDNHVIVTHEVSAYLAEHSTVPVFCYHDSVLGRGVLGGNMTSSATYAQLTYHSCKQLFEGKKTGEIIQNINPTSYYFDWNEMKRLKVKESQLPEGSTVFFRPDTLWSRYKGYILAITIIVAVQTILIILLILSSRKQKDTEARLHKSLTHIRSISDNFRKGMIYQIVIKKDGRREFTYLSENVRMLYQVSPQEGMKDSSLIYSKVHPDDIKTLIQLENEALDKMCLFQTEARIYNPDGTIRWSSLVSFPSRLDNGDVIWDGIEYIITDLKLIEEKLKKSERQLKEAQKMASIGSWEIDQTTHEFIWSDEVYKIFDIDQRVFRATYDSFIEAIHPDDRDLVDEIYKNSLADHAGFDITHRLQMKDGSVKYVHDQCEHYFNVDGNPARSVGTIQDITDQVIRKEQLEQSLREKETLIRELYHRTKNNKQVIRSLLYLQASTMPESQEVKKLVQNTDNRIMAISLVHQKLYQSQDLSKINMAEYIPDLCQLILKSYNSSNQSINVVSDIGEIYLLLDTAIPLGLIINELITNSIKYAFHDMNQGEISIGLFRNKNGKLELNIGDNGKGVAAGFDIRRQNSLGLQTVVALAEQQMKGMIRLESETGMKYRIEFPDTLYNERV